MGNRGNIVIEQDNDWFPAPVFFYTHWTGDSLRETLKSALERGRDRWDDPPYLARAIFCEMVKPDSEGLTGFGIATSYGDGTYPLLCVDMKECKVRLRDSVEDINAAVLHEWSFEEFCKPEAAGGQPS